MTGNIIPYGKQFIDKDDIDAVTAALRSDLITTGPHSLKFEEALADRVGTRYAVVFSSGTAALHAAYFAAGLKPGEEIITTPITFAATANAALYLGAKPVFVDIADGSFNIDHDLIEKAITEKTRIIAPVDMTGMPVDIDRIMAIAEKYGLIVVEDASHALGATYKELPVGATAHMTIFSFHPVKQITTGEGGAVTTNDSTLDEKLRMFRSHGITKNPGQFVEKNPAPWHQEMLLLGYNYRLTDIQCALGLSQLKKLDFFLARRREIAERYCEAFKDCPGIALPPFGNNANPAWHLFVIRLIEDIGKLDAMLRLSELEVGTQLHYIPVYHHPYYQTLDKNRYKPENFPFAELYYEQALTIPLYPAMTDREVTKVIYGVREVCG